MSVELNEVGDVVLDPTAIRVLCRPGLYELLERLRKLGPSTPAAVNADADELAALARVGLVAGPDSSGRWTAVGRGLYLAIPTDPAALAEVRGLVGIMLLDGADAPRRWVEHESPGLEPEWMAASGRLSVRVALTPDELNEIQAALERVLEPYLNRSAPVADTAREVQILSYFLPRSAPDPLDHRPRGW
jgi:hypothetical protein